MRIALEGSLSDLNDKKQDKKIDLSYKAVVGTDRQAAFSLKYKDKFETDSLSVSVRTSLNLEKRPRL